MLSPWALLPGTWTLAVMTMTTRSSQQPAQPSRVRQLRLAPLELCRLLPRQAWVCSIRRCPMKRKLRRVQLQKGQHPSHLGLLTRGRPDRMEVRKNSSYPLPKEAEVSPRVPLRSPGLVKTSQQCLRRSSRRYRLAPAIKYRLDMFLTDWLWFLAIWIALNVFGRFVLRRKP